MKAIKTTTLNYLFLATCTLFAVNSSAELSNDQTATVNFTGVASATYGWANETNGSTFIGGCGYKNCYSQNGVVVGIVKDPIDEGAHFHKADFTGSSTITQPAAHYHPDSTGIYVRMADLSKFSLQSLDLHLFESVTGGNFVIYGYSDAINPDILSADGNFATGAIGDELFVPTDPEGGNVPYLVSYVIPNTENFRSTITLAQLTAADPNWANIGAFWITFQNFNHSPTNSYPSSSVVDDFPVYPYPVFNLLLDNIVLGAAVAACQPSLQITIH